MLRLGCILCNLMNKCLHKSVDYKFYLFFSSDFELLEKIREDVLPVVPQLFSEGKQ